MRTLVLSLLAATAASCAFSQTATGGFPDGAMPLAPDDLAKALGDKLFHVQPASGPAWRLQYNANGYWFVNVGTFSDTGKWSVKDSTICAEGKQIAASCSDVRTKDGALYLKRGSGEIVKLEPR
mgnify:CR=1 FL=1